MIVLMTCKHQLLFLEKDWRWACYFFPFSLCNAVLCSFLLCDIYSTKDFTYNWVFTVAVLRSEIPSGMCAKFRTVAASNNRDHARNLSSRTLVTFNRSHVNIGRVSTLESLLLLLARATYVMVLFFTHIPFVVNHTINATPPERLQQQNIFV